MLTILYYTDTSIYIQAQLVIWFRYVVRLWSLCNLFG